MMRGGGVDIEGQTRPRQRRRWMRWRHGFLATFLCALALSAAAQQPLSMLVAIEPIETDANQAYVRDYQPLIRRLAEGARVTINSTLSREMSREMQASRSSAYDLMVGPPHVVGSALRYQYELLGTYPGDLRVAFVVGKDSPIKNIDGLKGTTVALPSVESYAAYVGFGELNKRKFLAKDAGTTVRNQSTHESALYAVEIGRAQAAVADVEIAKAWAARTGGRIIYESPPIPAISIAVSTALPKPLRERLRERLLDRSGAGNLFGHAPLAGEATTFAYVNTLTYMTPAFLPGATVVSAARAQALMGEGAQLYDVRTEAEYKRMHIRGAKFVPYVEHSKKEIGFDPKLDVFDFEAQNIPHDKPLVFACNGEECWKSYKAAARAIALGYRTVYWLRGGLPEWRARQLPVESVKG